MKRTIFFIASLTLFVSLILSQFKILFCEKQDHIFIRGLWYDTVTEFITVVDEPNEYDYEIGEYDFYSEKIIFIIRIN